MMSPATSSGHGVPERGSKVDTALLWAAVRDAPFGFAVLDSSLRYVYVNEALARMEGVPLHDHHGRSVRDIVPDRNDDAARWFAAVLADQSPAPPEYSAERAAMPNRSPAAVFPVAGPLGEGYVGVIVGGTADAELAERNARIVEVLQRALLPAPSLTAVEGVELEGAYMAARGDIVGGDWYGSVPLGESRIALGIGDVAGHGLDAVRAMAEVRFGQRSFASLGAGPSEILSDLNDQLHRFPHQPMVTTLAMRLDAADMIATVASAGHLPPVVRHRTGVVDVVDIRPGPPIGTVPSCEYPEVTFDISPGDTFLLYTDGLIERREEPITTSIDRLRAFLADLDVGSLSDVCTQLMGQRPDEGDDCALVIARVRGSGLTRWRGRALVAHGLSPPGAVSSHPTAGTCAAGQGRGVVVGAPVTSPIAQVWRLIDDAGRRTFRALRQWPRPCSRQRSRLGASPRRLLHRHVGVHRVQGVRGCMQGVEPRARGRSDVHGHVL